MSRGGEHQYSMSIPIEDAKFGPAHRGASDQVRLDFVTWSKDLSLKGVPESANSLHESLYKMHQLLVYELTKGYSEKEQFADFEYMVRSYKKTLSEIRQVEDRISAVRAGEVGDDLLSLKEKRQNLESDFAMLRADIVTQKKNVYKGVPGFEDLGIGCQIIEDIPEDDLPIEIAKLKRNIKDVEEAIEGLLEHSSAKSTPVATKKLNPPNLSRWKNFFDSGGKEKVDNPQFVAKKVLSAGRGGSSSLQIGGKEMKVDYLYRNAPSIAVASDSKAQKAKVDGVGIEKILVEDHERLTKNMALANFSFIVQYPNGYTGSVVVPVRIPGVDVLNLEHFMSLPDFAGQDLSKEQVAFRIARDVFFAGAHAIDAGYKEALEGNFHEGPGNHNKSLLDSEQFLFAALRYNSDARIDIVSRFLGSLKASDDAADKFSIKEMVLGLHSSRYICDKCATSAIGMQQGNHEDGSFLSMMVKEILRQAPSNIKIDDSCGVTIRASAGVEYGDEIPRIEVYNSSNSTINRKKISEIDIRDNIGCYKPEVSRHGLSKDLKNHTLFVSGGGKLDRFNEAYSNVVDFDPYRERPDLEDSAVRYEERKMRRVVAGVVSDAIRRVEINLLAEGFVDRVIDKAVKESESSKRPSSSLEDSFAYSVGNDGELTMEF